MTETPTQRADRADRMLERCRDHGTVRLSHLESLRNDLRAVANEYDDLAANRAQAPHALLPEPFGAWLDEQMRKQDLGVLGVADHAHGMLSIGDIANWRAGRTTPNLHEAYLLANALGVSLIDTLTAAGYGDVVVAIAEENDEARAANEPAIGERTASGSAPADDELADFRALLDQPYPVVAAKPSAVSLLLAVSRRLLAKVDAMTTAGGGN